MKFKWTTRGNTDPICGEQQTQFIWTGDVNHYAVVSYQGTYWHWCVLKSWVENGRSRVGFPREGREIDRTTAKREAELWLRQNVL